MFNTFYGAIKNGRLGRLPYLGYSLAAAAIGILAWGGLRETFAASEEVNASAGGQFGILGTGLAAAMGSALFFALINMMAKRIRDIGLPGWWLILTIAVVGVFTFIVGGGQLIGGAYLLIGLSLLILPSDSFARYDSVPTSAPDRQGPSDP